MVSSLNMPLPLLMLRHTTPQTPPLVQSFLTRLSLKCCPLKP